MTRQFNFIDFLQDMQDNGNILRLYDDYDFAEDRNPGKLVQIVEFFTVGNDNALIGFSPVVCADDVPPIQYRFFKAVTLDWHLDDQFAKEDNINADTI